MVFGRLFLLLWSSTAVAHTILPTEALDCAHQYWSTRLNSGLISAHANTEVAKAGWYPSLSTNLSAQKELLLPPLVAQTTNSIVLSEKVFDLTRTYTIDQRHEEERASQDDLEDQVLSILQSTLISYFSAATSSIQSDIYLKRIERLKNFLDVVQELARLHVSDRTSAYNLSAELAQTKSDALQLQIDLKNSVAQFLGYLGGSAQSDLQVQTQYQLVRDIKLDAKNVAVQLPAVQSLHAQNQALTLGARSARAGYLPTVSFDAVYSPSKLNYSSAAAVAPDGLTTVGGYNPSSLTVGLQLSWSIFDQGVRSIESAAFDAQATTAESLGQARLNQNELQINNLVKQYSLSLESLAMTNERFKQASEAYESSLSLFQIGKISYLLVKDSENALFGAEMEVHRIQLQAAALNAQLSLYGTYDHGKYRHLASNVACKDLLY